MLSTIIEKLNESDPKTEGYSFSVRDVSFKDEFVVTKNELLYDSRTYNIRLLFSGKELKKLEQYQKLIISCFIYDTVEEEEFKVLKESNGQIIFPTHEGGEYKISCHVTVEV